MQRPRIAGILFGSPGAGSFVEAGVLAFARAREQLRANIHLHWMDRSETEWRIARLREIAALRPELIVLHGAQGEALAEALAPELPAIMFAVTQGHVLAPNVACYEVLLEQAAFLAGALAGWSTRSGVIGHLSGERVRAGLKARAGFAAGVRFASADARLISTFCGSQHDAELAARCVAAQHRAGADIVFTMLGAGRDGAIRASRELGTQQIGDGGNWCATHPDVFLASAIADSGWGSLRAVQDFLAGELRTGRRETIGLEDPRVCGLATNSKVGAELRRRVDSLADDILNGAITIPTHWDGPEYYVREIVN